MVEQYRPAVGTHLLELPAGLLDLAGEPALDSAKRELYEEASLTAEHWQTLMDLHTSPGMSNEAIRIYLARGLSRGPRGRAVRAGARGTHHDRCGPIRWPSWSSWPWPARLTNGPAVAAIFAAEAARACRLATGCVRPMRRGRPGPIGYPTPHDRHARGDGGQPRRGRPRWPD